MKILVLISLMASFAIFAKPNIKYKYIPKDASLVGYISTKNIMKSKHYKKIMKTKDGKALIADLKKLGINIKKIGSMFFYSNSDKLMDSKNPRSDVKNMDAAIILNGISLEKAVKGIIAKSEKSKDKLAKIETYKGFKVYTEVKLDESDNETDEIPVDTVTFIKGNSVIGTTDSVKSVIDTFKGKSFFKSGSLVNKLYASLSKPDVFIVNIFNAKQKSLLNTTLAKSQTNPVVTMLGLAPLVKTIEVAGFTSKLKGNKVQMSIMAKANKSSIKAFTTASNMMLKQYKPMIMQQIPVYGATLGKTGVKELKSIVNSIKIIQKKDLVIISLSVNIKNVVKIMDKMNSKPKAGNQEEMLRMMNKRK